MSYVIMRHLRRASIFFQQIRCETTMININQEDLVFRPPFSHWGKIIREAEKIVGYPTSFMNLRWLLSDEFANMAQHLRKVVGSNHPILQTAKSVLYNEQNNLQPWGLIILLLSNAIKSESNIQSNKINENQRILAELTEMLRTGHYVHRGLLNVPFENRSSNTDTAMFGNKIAILIGDYLLVTANGMLAKIRNQDLSYLIATALRDLSCGEFYGERDSQNFPLPGQPVKENDSYRISSDTLPLETERTLGNPVREWSVRTLSNGGRLFGRGCQGAVLLAGHDLQNQEKAYLFGCHLCLAWQAASEIQKFKSDCKESFSLVSAPVLFAINENQDLYDNIVLNKDKISNVDLEALKVDVLKTNAIEKTVGLYEKHAKKAINFVTEFGDNDSINTIKKMINTLPTNS